MAMANSPTHHDGDFALARLEVIAVMVDVHLGIDVGDLLREPFQLEMPLLIRLSFRLGKTEF